MSTNREPQVGDVEGVREKVAKVSDEEWGCRPFAIREGGEVVTTGFVCCAPVRFGIPSDGERR